MFDVLKIQNEFRGMVGIRPSLDERYQFISQASTSGLYLNDVELFDIKFFVDNLSTDQSDPNVFFSGLAQLEDSANINTVNSVFTKPSYIDRQVMFKNAYESNNFLPNLEEQHSYGYEIEVSSKKNVAFTLNRVIIEARGVGEFFIVLYASGSEIALKRKSVTFPTDHNLPFSVDLNWVVNNAMETTSPLLSDVLPYKGKYFVGVQLTEGCVFTPRSRDYERGEIQSFISELCVDTVVSEGFPSEWSKSESYDTHNGLNFDVTVNYDYTDLAVNNKFMFAKAVQLNWAMSILRMAMNTTRSNRNQRISTELYSQILLVLNGNRNQNTQRVVGLNEMYLGEIARLQSELFKIEEGYFGNNIVMDTVC